MLEPQESIVILTNEQTLNLDRYFIAKLCNTITVEAIYIKIDNSKKKCRMQIPSVVIFRKINILHRTVSLKWPPEIFRPA